MMKAHISREQCCGCEACVNICPRQAIVMEMDDEGFYYPNIDEAQCVNCHLCEETCPTLNIKQLSELKEVSIGGYIEHPEILKKCASGGFLSNLSESFIQAGGVVYGVRYSVDFFYAEYIRCVNTTNISALRSSKYIQARKGDIYQQVQTDLKDGRKVMFCGLPCEVNALKLFLHCEEDNLFTCALICHGPTSEKVHQQYCAATFEGMNSPMCFFSVRDKHEGWKPYYIRAEFENGQQHVEKFADSTYGKAFLYMKRPSCNVCQIKRGRIMADITTGDFHYGYGTKEEPYHFYGVSSILVHTQRGEELLEMLHDFVLKEIPLEHALHNAAYLHATPAKKNRVQFGRKFATCGLQAACNLASCKIIEFKKEVRVFILEWILRVKRWVLG